MAYIQYMVEREGFEPSIELQTLYSLSRGAPSATRTPLQRITVCIDGSKKNHQLKYGGEIGI